MKSGDGGGICVVVGVDGVDAMFGWMTGGEKARCVDAGSEDMRLALAWIPKGCPSELVGGEKMDGRRGIGRENTTNNDATNMKEGSN